MGLCVQGRVARNRGLVTLGSKDRNLESPRKSTLDFREALNLHRWLIEGLAEDPSAALDAPPAIAAALDSADYGGAGDARPG